MRPLTDEQQQWVNRTLASSSLEQQLAQLLIPKLEADGGVEPLLKQMERIPFGGLFVWGATEEAHRKALSRIQAAAAVPVVVCADLENGSGYVIRGRPQFPDMLALGAADDEMLAYTVGKAAGRDGRSVGIHWSFGPVVDVNINPDNPIANTRSLGDDPEHVSRLAVAVIRGMQDHGLAACAKHFPGDGVDDVDQHVTISVNDLSLERWKKISGRTFAAAIAADVHTIMIGHIALPAWDPATDHRGALRPATVNRRIVHDLLREEMGFEGLVVTDDMNMGGVAGYVNFRERTIGCIRAGCDMLLFPRMPDAYDILLEAVRKGELEEARVQEAARRVLELKARLQLCEDARPKAAATAAETVEFESAAGTVAARAVQRVRDVNGILPLRGLKPGSRVLTVTLSGEGFDLPVVDEELARRGFQVEHIAAAGYGAVDPYVDRVDAIFVNFAFGAGWCVGSVRSIGPQNRVFMNGFQTAHPKVVFTSFGSPYHLRQFSALPVYINAHSASAASQRAAVKAWLGEAPMEGRSPVGNLVRTF